EMREALEACTTVDHWDRHSAKEWWTCHGCPEKKRLDREIMEVAQSR
ncbi:MAG: hypothetical protein ACI9G1_001425, partial [Pirellulaceae bacterium]